MHQYSDTDHFNKFCRQLDKYPPLPKEEQLELARMIQGGDKKARHKLFNHHLLLVVQVTNKYLGYTMKGKVSRMEMIQAGCEGLLRAIDKFEPERGFQLNTYALHWIRTKIANLILQQQHRLVRITLIKSNYAFFYNNADLVTIANSRDEDEREEIRQRLMKKRNVSRKNILHNEALANMQEVESDRLIGDENELSIVDMLSYPEENQVFDSPDKQVDKDLRKNAVQQAMSKLNKRERLILTARWLGEEKLTLRELGEKLNIAHETIRQVQVRAMNKMKIEFEKQGHNNNTLLG